MQPFGVICEQCIKFMCTMCTCAQFFFNVHNFLNRMCTCAHQKKIA